MDNAEIPTIGQNTQLKHVETHEGWDGVHGWDGAGMKGAMGVEVRMETGNRGLT